MITKAGGGILLAVVSGLILKAFENKVFKSEPSVIDQSTNTTINQNYYTFPAGTSRRIGTPDQIAYIKKRIPLNYTVNVLTTYPADDQECYSYGAMLITELTYAGYSGFIHTQFGTSNFKTNTFKVVLDPKNNIEGIYISALKKGANDTRNPW
ncbi:MAG: hypothetical protein V4725_17335 [Bacteroidota bacterium]|nr:hypothetical protein [Ferruginibacter sp.]